MNSNEHQQPVVNPWMIALAVMLGTFMEVLDTSIANVSLSHIAGSLSVSTEESTWVLTTYLIANAIVIPSSAWLGNRFGRKRFLMACLAIFTTASFLCGLATSLPMLLVMRALQGAGGGALQPVAQAILLESFPKEKQGAAMGVYGFGVVLAPVLGPVLGGWITDNYSWRWIFYINVPFGILALMMVGRYIHDPHWIRNAKVTRLDTIGLAFMSLWLGCQEVLLDKGQEDDWFGSRFIQVMTALAVVGFVVFVWRGWTMKEPLVQLRVMKHYNFALGVTLMFFLGISLYGLTAILPLFLQELLGYTSLQSGWSMVPRGLGAMVAMPLAGKLVGKLPGRAMLAFGFLCFGLSAAVLSRITLDVSPEVLVWPLFFSGLSMGFMFVPLNTLAMGNLPPQEIGNASGIYNLVRNVGGSVGISLVTTLAARGAQSHQARLVEHLNPYDPVYQSRLAAMQSAFAAHSGDAVAAQQQAHGMMYGMLQQQAGLLAYLDNFRWFALLCFVGVAAAFLMKNVKAHGPIAAH